MDEYGNVKDLVQVDDRREPAIGEKARIRYDKKCAGRFFAEIELFWADLEGRRRDDVFELQNPLLINILGQEGDERLFVVFFIE